MGTRTGTILTLLILPACAGPSRTSTPEPQQQPVAHTRYEANTWQSSGQVRVHAALRIDPVFIAPDIEQNAFSLDGYIVEVMDVEPSGDDRYIEGHWRSDRMISGVNVQVRVTPNP